MNTDLKRLYARLMQDGVTRSLSLVFLVSVTIGAITLSYIEATGRSVERAFTYVAIVSALPSVVGAVTAGLTQFEALRRRRQLHELDSKIGEIAVQLENESDEAILNRLVAATAGDSTDVELRRQRVQRYLVDESTLRQEVESLAFGYMPQRPRGVKRAANHLRLQLALVVSRNVLGGSPPISTAHISKWIVLGYSWPSVAAAVIARPALMQELEAASADMTLHERLGTARVSAQREGSLAELFNTEPKLGLVVARLIGLEVADPSRP